MLKSKNKILLILNFIKKYKIHAPQQKIYRTKMSQVLETRTIWLSNKFTISEQR